MPKLTYQMPTPFDILGLSAAVQIDCIRDRRPLTDNWFTEAAAIVNEGFDIVNNDLTRDRRPS